MSAKELDSLLSILSEKKKKAELEETEANLQLLFSFMQCLRKQKFDELHEIQNDLEYIKEDISAVEKCRLELYQARDRYSAKTWILRGQSSKKGPVLRDKHTYGTIPNVPNAQGERLAVSNCPQAQITQDPFPYQLIQSEDEHNGSVSEHNVARRRQVHAQFIELEECYLQKRRHYSAKSQKREENVETNGTKERYSTGLEEFQYIFSAYTRYSQLQVVAEFRHTDLFHTVNIVSSIEFNRDDELFAIAGVSRRIKVFDFADVVNKPGGVQCPVVEMPTRSKLSCLSWNKCKKNYIASSDYEGIVTVWDVTTRQSVMECEEHEKRAWCVDFSCTEPSMLVSGSDDCKVKVWCMRQEDSVLSIDMKANICSVKYNPGSSFHVAVGSADHHIHYYDLRSIKQPLHVFSGHSKAVSYVKFVSNNELASASTDSTIRLWDVKANVPLRTYRGHTNERNFVGLTVNTEYIACGSERNEVFAYHKAISKPAAWYSFGSDTSDGDEERGGAPCFISAVCWKSDSPTILCANSLGVIKVLSLAAG